MILAAALACAIATSSPSPAPSPSPTPVATASPPKVHHGLAGWWVNFSGEVRIFWSTITSPNRLTP